MSCMWCGEPCAGGECDACWEDGERRARDREYERQCERSAEYDDYWEEQRVLYFSGLEIMALDLTPAPTREDA